MINTIEKAIVIGLGSMGKRRIRLLKQINANIQLIGVDSSEARRAEGLENGLVATYESIEEAANGHEVKYAFVCTSPVTHFSIIDTCLNMDINVFTELNLISDGYEILIEKAQSKGLTLFLSSTLLYRKDIQYINNLLKGKKVNYIYHTGQYLPDWHPWESYKSFFVNDKRTNGCREIFAIDLPWLINGMGKVTYSHVLSDKMSSLELDYNDNFIVNFKHESGSKGVICVDVVSRKARRVLEIYSEEMHLFWDGTPNSLRIYDLETKEERFVETYNQIDKDSNYCDNIIENAYMEELITFFSTVNGDGTPLYTFADDLYTLNLIDRIEGDL